jgi:hypothetical protein
MAASLPKFREKDSQRTPGWSAASRRTISNVPSVEPSSTKMYSVSTPSRAAHTAEARAKKASTAASSL